MILDLELSSACNANCSFCPRKHLRRKKANLSVNDLTSVLTQALQFSTINIGFVGMGEPLLNKPMFFAALQLLEEIPMNKADILLIMNATLVDEQFVNNPLLKRLNRINVSASGYNYLEYEKLYNYSWDNTLRNIKNIRTRCPHLKLCVIGVDYLGKRNIKLDQNEIYSSCKRNRIFYSLNPLHSRGGFLYKYKEPVTNNKMNCRVYNDFIFVSSDGNYLSCCHDLTQMNILGTIQNTPLIEIKSKKTKFPDVPYPICVYCDDIFV
jgi:MoaA/NifB/PqqE/SkfB family radical SAM enzyme